MFFFIDNQPLVAATNFVASMGRPATYLSYTSVHSPPVPLGYMTLPSTPSTVAAGSRSSIPNIYRIRRSRRKNYTNKFIIDDNQYQLTLYLKLFKCAKCSLHDRNTNGRTDRRTDGRIDGRWSKKQKPQTWISLDSRISIDIYPPVFMLAIPWIRLQWCTKC